MKAKLGIKPISVNQCWQGKRYKTKTYKDFEKAMLLLMPKGGVSCPPYRVDLIFGFSTSTSDIDNPIKPVLDIIQKKYNINDRDIYEINVTKKVVKKGNEYIYYEINSTF